jgi:DNA-binding transcriptional regulator YiaG
MRETNVKCMSCGVGEMKWRAHKHTENVGGIRVVDQTAFADVCMSCGAADLTDEQLRGYELRAAALVLREKYPVPGSVIKYARKALGLTQSALGDILGHKPETVSRWENNAGGAMQRDGQLALVAVLDAAGRDMIDELQNPTPVVASEGDLEVTPPKRACGGA